MNRISINRPDEANIKEISYQLFEHSKKSAGPPLFVIDLEDGITRLVLVGFDYKLAAGRLILGPLSVG